MAKTREGRGQGRANMPKEKKGKKSQKEGSHTIPCQREVEVANPRAALSRFIMGPTPRDLGRTPLWACHERYEHTRFYAFLTTFSLSLPCFLYLASFFLYFFCLLTDFAFASLVKDSFGDGHVRLNITTVFQARSGPGEGKKVGYK